MHPERSQNRDSVELIFLSINVMLNSNLSSFCKILSHCRYPGNFPKSGSFEMDRLITLLSDHGKGTMDLSLTSAGFSMVNWDSHAKEFMFVFGEDKSFSVQTIIAEFLSPKVARMRRFDASVNSYTLTSEYTCACTAFQALVESFCHGKPLTVGESNFEDLIRLACGLENDELLAALLGMMNLDEWDVEKAITLLQMDMCMRGRVVTHYDELVAFVASRFHEISEATLKGLDIETAAAILSHPELHVVDEDTLYDFIRSRAEDDKSFAPLLEFVYFEYLSTDRIEDFAEFATDHLLDALNASLWSRVCRRLINANATNGQIRSPRVSSAGSDAEIEQQEQKPPGTEFSYDAFSPLNGIIAHFTREYGGNVHEKGVVNVTSSSVYYSGAEANNAVDLEGESYFISKDEVDTWICYDFKQWRVAPTSYTIKTYSSGTGWHHLKSWVFEVSHDGDSWETVDRRDNNNDLNNSSVTRNFAVSSTGQEGYRYIRLRQTGPNHHGDYWVEIASLEIFGGLSNE